MTPANLLKTIKLPAFGLSLALALSVPGCSSSTPVIDDCFDGLDNDGDGFIDDSDPGCAHNDGLAEAPDPKIWLCDDGLDNDGDGLIDFPADPGCAAREDDDESHQLNPQCFDGIDNDGDGLIDYPSDPGCFSTLANDESDDCPSGPLCPECSNRIDDDGDGVFDYPADPGCDTSFDDDEFNANVTNCGSGVDIIDVPPVTVVGGQAMANGPSELISPTCGGLGQETVYRFEVTEPAYLVATTVNAGTNLDTVLYLRETCRDIDTELACNDDDGGLSSTIETPVEAGTYFIIVDSHHPTSEGNFILSIQLYLSPGEECDPMMPACAPGQVCRPADDNTTIPTCELPSCMDGRDNDFDGRADFPLDPGCTEAMDNDESDDCPAGPGCPECGNGDDDDGDGLSDYPDDLGCTSASDTVEADCQSEQDPIGIVVASATNGSTSGASHVQLALCVTCTNARLL